MLFDFNGDSNIPYTLIKQSFQFECPRNKVFHVNSKTSKSQTTIIKWQHTCLRDARKVTARGSITPQAAPGTGLTYASRVRANVWGLSIISNFYLFFQIYIMHFVC